MIMVIQVSKHGQPKWVKYKMRVWVCLTYDQASTSQMFGPPRTLPELRRFHPLSPKVAGWNTETISWERVPPCLKRNNPSVPGPLSYQVLSCFHSKLTGYTFKSGFNVRTMLSILKMQTKYRMMMRTVKCFQFCSGFGRRDGWFTQAT